MVVKRILTLSCSEAMAVISSSFCFSLDLLSANLQHSARNDPDLAISGQTYGDGCAKTSALRTVPALDTDISGSVDVVRTHDQYT